MTIIVREPRDDDRYESIPIDAGLPPLNETERAFIYEMNVEVSRRIREEYSKGYVAKLDLGPYFVMSAIRYQRNVPCKEAHWLKDWGPIGSIKWEDVRWISGMSSGLSKPTTTGVSGVSRGPPRYS